MGPWFRTVILTGIKRMVARVPEGSLRRRVPAGVRGWPTEGAVTADAREKSERAGNRATAPVVARETQSRSLTRKGQWQWNQWGREFGGNGNPKESRAQAR